MRRPPAPRSGGPGTCDHVGGPFLGASLAGDVRPVVPGVSGRKQTRMSVRARKASRSVKQSMPGSVFRAAAPAGEREADGRERGERRLAESAEAHDADSPAGRRAVGGGGRAGCRGRAGGRGAGRGRRGSRTRASAWASPARAFAPPRFRAAGPRGRTGPRRPRPRRRTAGSGRSRRSARARPRSRG